MLRTDSMVDAADAPLYQRPEAINGVGVNIPSNVHLRGMVYPAVRVTALAQSSKLPAFIGVDDGPWQDVPADEWHHAAMPYVIDWRSPYLTLALDDAEDRRLVLDVAASSSPSSAADVGMIHLDVLAERFAVFLKKRANLPEHAMRCFVGYADLALQLLRRDTAPGRSHQEGSVEPQLQRCPRVLVDSASHGVNVVAAPVA